MSKVIKTFTFWFTCISILIIIINLIGQDDKNILLIGANPALNILLNYKNIHPILWDNSPTVIMYLFHLITYGLFGIILDLFFNLYKRAFEIIKKSK